MKTQLANENGSIMVITLLVMAILTVIGISAINQSTIDVMISGNERQYKQNFFRAEAAANEGIQRVDNADGNDLLPENEVYSWLRDDDDWPLVSGQPSIEDPSQWDPTDAPDDAYNAAFNSVKSVVDPDTRFAVIMAGVAGGGSIDITAPSQLFEVEIHGQYSRNQTGWSQVAIGYRRRF
jgi:hypothetical protein